MAATQYILGIRPEYDGLTIDPCLPSAWDGFKATRVFRGAIYRIEVENPTHVSKGVESLRLDGRAAERIPVFPAGTAHGIKVIMG